MMPGQLMTPVPSFGSTSLTWLRSGSAFPRTTSTSRMTRNGTAWVAPVKVLRCRKVLHVVLVVGHLRLADADQQTTEQRQREGLEGTEQRGGEGGDRDHQREDLWGEAGERRHQDAGEAGQALRRPSK